MLERPLALRRHHSAHESWEGLHQVADRDGSLRLRLKGLILLSAAGARSQSAKMRPLSVTPNAQRLCFVS
jgi:hypothetical protein